MEILSVVSALDGISGDQLKLELLKTSVDLEF
jgi:hypothetical protein